MHYFPVDGVRAGGCVPYLLTVSDSHELNRRNLTSQATQGWGIGLVRLAKGGGEKKEEEKERKQRHMLNLHHRRAWLQSRDRTKSLKRELRTTRFNSIRRLVERAVSRAFFWSKNQRNPISIEVFMTISRFGGKT